MGELLKDKVAVVTGAGQGLGRAEAIELAAQGAKVVVNDLGTATDGRGSSKGPAENVVAEINKADGEAVANYNSVATIEGAESIIQTAVDSFGRIDVLVNNAGFNRDRMIYNISDEEWDSVMKTNLYGTFYTTRAACKVMRQQKYGRIINTSSHAGLGAMGQANYSAAKEGIVGLTRTVAYDMGRYGVTCNVIRPVSGTRGFVELVKDKKTLKPFPRRDKVAERLWATIFQKGVLIYNSTGLAGIDGDALLIGPPFIIEENDMDAVVDAIDQAMADVLG